MEADKDARKRVETLRQLIAGSSEDRVDDIAADDRNALIEFDEQLVSDRKSNNRCGWKHHKNVLGALFRMAVETDNALAASLEDGQKGERAVDELTDWVHDTYDNEYSVQSNLSAIRVFAATVFDIESESLPQRFSNIEPGSYVSGNRAPLTGEVIQYEDLLELIDAAEYTRDKAMIATQWDSGPRPMEEMYPLQYKQIELKDGQAKITLPRTNGKTNERALVITVGFPHLKKWIKKEHPVHADPDDDLGPETYIWTTLKENTLPTYQGFSDRFTKAGEVAGLDKSSTAQNLRRSAASELAKQPEIGERDLRHYFDWAFTSYSPEHYITQFSSVTETNVVQARGHNLQEYEKEADTAPVPCTNCGNWTMRKLDECVACGVDRDPEQATFNTSREIEHPVGDNKELAKKILDGDVTARDLDGVEKVADNIRGMGERFFRQLPELKQKAEALESANDDRENKQFVTGAAGAAATGVAAVTEAAADIVSGWHRALTLSPKYQDYPMDRRQQLMYSAGVTVWLGVIATMLTATGHTDALAAGNPLDWAGLILGLVAGFAVVHRDIPSVAEAVAEQH